jgi:hypothetical protein
VNPVCRQPRTFYQVQAQVCGLVGRLNQCIPGLECPSCFQAPAQVALTAAVMQDVIVTIWPRVIICAYALYQFDCQRLHDVDNASAWATRFTLCLKAIAPGILKNLLVVWDAAQAQHAGNGRGQLVEMCTVFALAWAWRGLEHDSLSTRPVLAMEATFCSAALDAGFILLPDKGQLWTSIIDAQHVSWVPAHHQTNNMSSYNEQLQLSNTTQILCCPTQASCLIHNVAGHVLASQGSAIVVAQHQADLVSVQRVMDRVPVASHTTNLLHRMGIKCCALTAPHDMQVCLLQHAGLTE